MLSVFLKDVRNDIADRLEFNTQLRGKPELTLVEVGPRASLLACPAAPDATTWSILPSNSLVCEASTACRPSGWTRGTHVPQNGTAGQASSATRRHVDCQLSLNYDTRTPFCQAVREPSAPEGPQVPDGPLSPRFSPPPVESAPSSPPSSNARG